MADPIIFRGIERILIVLVAGLFGWLGYKLYLRGHDQGRTNLKMRSGPMNFLLSGVGPGLAFMGLAAAVLIYSLITGRARTTEHADPQSAEALNSLSVRVAALEIAAGKTSGQLKQSPASSLATTEQELTSFSRSLDSNDESKAEDSKREGK